VHYATVAEVFGLRGIRLDHPDQVNPAWDEAFRADRPIVIDAITDPETPLTPPHVEWRQLSNLAHALRHGDPNRRHVITQGIRERVHQLLDHAHEAR